MWIFIIFDLARLLIACVLGLFLPGYLLARILRSGASALLAFPLSLVILFHCIFLVGLLGCGITFAHVLIPVLVVDFILIWGCPGLLKTPSIAARYSSRNSATGTLRLLVADESDLPSRISAERECPRSAAPESMLPPRGINWRSLGFFLAAISLALLIQQCLLTPLSGYDTIFRWDYLARRVLELRTFNFYPPRRPIDFKDYFYVDSFPPIVSFSYWWLYAAFGRYVAQISAIVVAAQYAVVIGLTFALARKLAGPARGAAAGALAIGLLATSSAYFRDQAIGQESGLLAVSLISLLWVLLAEPADARAMILAGICAGVGAMCREYGWAYVLFGLLLVMAKHRSAKLATIFFLASLAIAGPWYLRNLVLTGNPFYSMTFLGFPGNHVFADMLESFPPHFGVRAWNAHRWKKILVFLFVGSPLQLTLGIAALIALWRRCTWLAVATAMSFALWLYSAGYTAGGEEYSSRTLAPLWPVLSISAALLLASWRPSLQKIPMAAIIGCFLVALTSDWIFPFSFFNPPPGSWADVGLHTHPRYDIEEAMVPEVQRLLPPHARILGDEFAGYPLLRQAGYQLVPPWSLEVAFLFDPNVSAHAACEKMHQLHIDYVLAVPRGAFTYYFVDHSRFYQGASRWKLIATTPGLLLFQLPH